MSTPTEQFTSALESWRAAQLDAARARLGYERARNAALMKATGRTAELREAEAEIEASAQRLDYEHAQIEAKALEHWVCFLRMPRAVHGPEGLST